MRQFEFTEKEIEQLAYEREHHPHHIVRRRMNALYLKAKGMSHQIITEVLDITPQTLGTYFDLFEAGRVEGLKQLRYKGQPSELNEYTVAITTALEENPPATLKEARDRIEKVTGLKRSLPQIGDFLRKNKMVRRKVKQIPDKADLEAQETFKAGTLEPLVEQAQQGQIHLFFVDAAHFVLLPFLGYLYSLTVRYIRSASGRKRFNVLGALHAITRELVTITNDSYINATSVCALLEKLAEQFADLPIVLVMDNARYQRCKLVIEKALSLGIELVFLPPYSPNLNLIERLWRFVKKEVLYNKYHPDYQQFSQAITNCLDQIHTTHREAMETLLTPKFQSWRNSDINP